MKRTAAWNAWFFRWSRTGEEIRSFDGRIEIFVEDMRRGTAHGRYEPGPFSGYVPFTGRFIFFEPGKLFRRRMMIDDCHTAPFKRIKNGIIELDECSVLP